MSVLNITSQVLMLLYKILVLNTRTNGVVEFTNRDIQKLSALLLGADLLLASQSLSLSLSKVISFPTLTIRCVVTNVIGAVRKVIVRRTAPCTAAVVAGRLIHHGRIAIHVRT